MHKSPFKFLDSYTKEDKDIFFGRDNEVEEIYHKIFSSKTLLVYGVSGTGKSSIIQCGLANRFEDSDWLPVSIRRGSDMNVSYEKALAKIAVTPIETLLEDKANGIAKAVQSAYLDHFKPIYFIFDQFEELFIFGSKAEKKEFIQTVKKIIKSNIQTKFVFVIREEYLAGITEFESELTSIMENRIRIEKMSLTHAKDVIEGSCKAGGIEVEEGFSEALLENLKSSSGEIELTYLQVYLDRIYQKAVSAEQNKTVFTKALLEGLGDVADILGNFLDEQIKKLPDPESGTTVLKSFVSLKGTKKQVTEEEVSDSVKSFGKELSLEQIREIIRQFISFRILKDKDESSKYELRHDALALKIYEKITMLEKELLEVRQYIENAYSTYKKNGLLLGKESLKYIELYLDKLYLNKEQSEFVDKSRYEIDKAEKKRKRITVTILSILLVIFALFTLWALRERNNAKNSQLEAIEKKNESNSNLYASYSFIELENDPTISFRLAEKAFETDKNNISALKAVLNSYYSGNFYSTVAEFEDSKNVIKLSPSKQIIIEVPFRSSNIRLWDLKGNKIKDFQNEIGSIVNIVFSPDDSFFVAGKYFEHPKMFNIKGDLIADLPICTPGDAEIAFADKSGIIAVAAKDSIKIFDKKGKLLDSKKIDLFHNLDYYLKDSQIENISNYGNALEITSISISDDGKYVAWGEIGRIGVWKRERDHIERINCFERYSTYSTGVNKTGTKISCFKLNLFDEGVTCEDSILTILNVKGEVLNKIRAEDAITSAKFTQSDKIVIALKNGDVVLYDEKGIIIEMIKTYQAEINQIELSESEEEIYTVNSAESPSRILKWDISQKTAVQKPGHEKKINTLNYSYDGKYIVTSGDDKSVILWDKSGGVIKVLKGHNDIVTDAKFTHDSKRIISSGNDGNVIVWDLEGNLLKKIISDYPAEALSISPDDSNISVVSPLNILKITDFDGNAILEKKWKFDYSWNTGHGSWRPREILLDTLGREINYNSWHKKYVNYAERSPDRKNIITASDDSTAVLWTYEGNEILRLDGHEDKVVYASFSGNGEKIVTACLDNFLRIYSKDGNLIKRIKTPKEHLRFVHFGRETDDEIFTQSIQDTVRCYGVNGNILESYKWERIYISSADYSPDGKSLLTASRDGNAKLWDIQSGEFKELGPANYSVFSPCGKSIGSSLWNYFYLLDLSGNVLSEKTFSYSLNSVRFSPDGKHIVLACRDNTAKIMDLKGNIIHTFEGFGNDVTSAAFSPCGKYIAMSNDKGGIQIWLIDPEQIIQKIKKEGIDELSISTKKKYKIDLNSDELIIENAREKLLTAKPENDLKNRYKILNEVASDFDLVLKNSSYSISSKDIADLEKDIADCYSELAKTETDNQNFKKAIELSDTGMKYGPNNPDLLIQKSIAMLYDSGYKTVENIFKEIKHKPVYTGDEMYYVLILKRINELEKKGITHVDLIKLRQELFKLNK